MNDHDNDTQSPSLHIQRTPCGSRQLKRNPAARSSRQKSARNGVRRQTRDTPGSRQYQVSTRTNRELRIDIPDVQTRPAYKRTPCPSAKDNLWDPRSYRRRYGVTAVKKEREERQRTPPLPLPCLTTPTTSLHTPCPQNHASTQQVDTPIEGAQRSK